MKRSSSHEPGRDRDRGAVPDPAVRPGKEPAPGHSNRDFLRELNSQPSNPESVQQDLGPGEPLPGDVRGRMETALGANLSQVELHNDPASGRLVQQQQASALTVGRHVAFAPGQYRPGTPFGDALLAHELAHVLQQRAAESAPPQENSGSLEADASRSAAGVVSRLWTGTRTAAQAAGPQMRAGLSVQHGCGPKKPPKAKKPPQKKPAPQPKPTAQPTPAKQPEEAKPALDPQIDPEKSFWFQDPEAQKPTESGKITTSKQMGKQVAVESVSKVGKLAVRFAYPAGKAASGGPNTEIQQAKAKVLKALGELFADLGSFDPVPADEEKRILEERARLSEGLLNFTSSDPLNIYLADPTDREIISGEYFPTTAAVFINLKDVGDPKKLKAAIRLPLTHLMGGPNPAKGKADVALNDLEAKRMLLHEGLHSLLVSRRAGSDTLWQELDGGKLAITGPAAAAAKAKDLVRGYVLAQEELFIYKAVELLYPPTTAGARPEATPHYETFANVAEKFLEKKSGGLKTRKISIKVSTKVQNKEVPWEIVYKFPEKLDLNEEDIKSIDVIMIAWPMQTRSRPKKP